MDLVNLARVFAVGVTKQERRTRALPDSGRHESKSTLQWRNGAEQNYLPSQKRRNLQPTLRQWPNSSATATVHYPLLRKVESGSE